MDGTSIGTLSETSGEAGILFRFFGTDSATGGSPSGVAAFIVMEIDRNQSSSNQNYKIS
jgi:hypothetical protein